ncbi:DUF1206 domain-containing protein [Sabulicella rubraurantiaca]|uniref:DUF1206 domain-containing protein n=1 Tax=Sabulicella rubraurantiaca TaxID=2811429 RepID=UPI001A973EBF|nr:DUF1206 domain-containing protein [Sabulicella rubraurantiaca]
MTHDRLVLLGRLGFAARGVVNLLVGGLALMAALGRGGEATGARGAIGTLLTQPLGLFILAFLALGLFGFALWRFLQSLLDADGLGRDRKALMRRAGQFISGVIYLGLAGFAASLAMGGAASGGEDEAARDWTRWLMSQPFGRWLVAGVGLGILGAAFGMARKAWTASFCENLSCGGQAEHWVKRLGQAGYAARAVVFVVIGLFLLIAAWQHDPNEVRGLGGALVALRAQPFGAALFGIVAAGLAAFGLFGLAEAWFRRMRTPPEAQAVGAMLSPGR